MFTPEQYREKAAQYTELARTVNTPNEVREFQAHERSLTMLAENKKWLADNLDEMPPVLKPSGTTKRLWQRKRSISCDALGAALIMQWNTLQTELQRELFDNAGSMGELSDTATLRGQIARFLRKHTDGHDEMGRSSVQ